ncbi:MAG: 50S ribosomal protein L4 [Patescibacteria group bacterium]
MEIDVFNKENSKIGTMELPEKIFQARWAPILIKQALLTQMANSRQNLAHVKDRAEVKGGGKKPWRQKGTGRARHGSIRSPLWSGGGVTFGPRNEKNFSRKINRKMKQLAVFSILSRKIKNENFKVIDELSFLNEKKSRIAINSLKKIINFDNSKNSYILILPSAYKSANLAVRNLKGLDAISAKSLNIYDLMKWKNIIAGKNAVEEIIEHYTAKK